ncbi:hypothetical protein EDD85DRAFT_932819, partial [Armillaria nabsnona]
MKSMQMFSNFNSFTDEISKTRSFEAEIDWSLIYILLTLSTTITCTFFIIYHILRHAPGMSASRKIIDMLIESSTIYSRSLIIYLALVSRNLESGCDADMIAAYMKDARTIILWLKSSIVIPSFCEPN